MEEKENDVLLLSVSELNRELREACIRHGLCDKWQGEWAEDWSLETLFERFYKGMDFFFKERYVSNDFLREQVSREERWKHGLVIEERRSFANTKRLCVLGASDVTARYSLWSAGEVYVGDTSRLKVIAKGQAFVMVHATGDAQVTVEASGKARVVVLRHDKGVGVHLVSGADVRVKDELGWLQ